MLGLSTSGNEGQKVKLKGIGRRKKKGSDPVTYDKGEEKKKKSHPVIVKKK